MNIRVNNDSSYIRILNTAVNGEKFDIYINDLLTFSNVWYKNFTPYSPMIPGKYNIKVYENGNNDNTILDQELNIAGGNIGTIVITGVYPKLMILAVSEDPNECIENKTSKFRLAHLSPTSPPIDLSINGVKMVDELPFGKSTNYAQIPSGIYDFLVEQSDIDIQVNKEKFRENKNIQLKDKKIYTIYVVGDGNNIDIIQSLDVTTYTNK